MQLSLALVTIALMLASPAVAFPRFDAESLQHWERAVNCNDGVQTPRKFVSPKPLPDGNTLKAIPGMCPFYQFQNENSANRVSLSLDAAHPYKAPGPGDTRGPCPAMNTLANHGYINRT
jgi:hypothetical protein